MCTPFEGGGSRKGALPDEAERDAQQREDLDDGEADPHERLSDAGSLGLTRGRLDVRSEDQTHTDTRADGGKAVPDGGGATGECGEKHFGVPPDISRDCHAGRLRGFAQQTGGQWPSASEPWM